MANELVNPNTDSSGDGLTSEALRPASVHDIMDALGKATDKAAPVSSPTQTRKRRGRPPGSTNRPKVVLTSAEQTIEDVRVKREAKVKRAKQIEEQIYGELNDQLMAFITTTFNVPIGYLYQPGKEPTVSAKDDRFTDLGARLAIPANLSKSIGKLASELEQTQAGSSLTGIAQNNNVGLIVAAGMTIFGTIQYARRVQDTLDKMKPFIEARKQMEQDSQPTQPQAGA